MKELEQKLIELTLEYVEDKNRNSELEVKMDQIRKTLDCLCRSKESDSEIFFNALANPAPPNEELQTSMQVWRSFQEDLKKGVVWIVNRNKR